MSHDRAVAAPRSTHALARFRCATGFPCWIFLGIGRSRLRHIPHIPVGKNLRFDVYLLLKRHAISICFHLTLSLQNSSAKPFFEVYTQLGLLGSKFPKLGSGPCPCVHPPREYQQLMTFHTRIEVAHFRKTCSMDFRCSFTNPWPKS